MHRSSLFPWTYLESMIQGYRNRGVFDTVRSYLMFIGHPRSGTSLVGSILNAHQNACVANELNALKWVERGYGRRQLFWVILKKDEEFGRLGRKWTGYDYEVEGQWQGRFEELLVIGDKKAALSADRLVRRPSLLQDLRSLVEVPVRMVHIVRDPFNIISTVHKKRSVPLEAAAETYFRRCDLTWRLMQSEPETIHTLRLEELVAAPADRLRDLCVFLGLEPHEEYLRASAKLFFSKPRQSKSDLKWPTQLVAQVSKKMEAYPFLEGYSYRSSSDAG